MKQNKKVRFLVSLFILLIGLIVVSGEVSAREDYLKPATGDLISAKPGIERVVATAEGGINVYAENGDLIEGYPFFIPNETVVSAPLVADVTGDGVGEIAIITRDASDVYRLEVIDANRTVLSSVQLSAAVYYDPVVLPILGAPAQDILLVTTPGTVLSFHYQNGVLTPTTIKSFGEAIGVSSDAKGLELAITFPQKNKVELYSKSGSNWNLIKTITVASPWLYPATYGSFPNLIGVSNNAATVVDKTTGVVKNDFPVVLPAAPIDSAYLAEAESGEPGMEIAVPLITGQTFVVSAAGKIFLPKNKSDNFIQTNGTVAESANGGFFHAVQNFAVSVYNKTEHTIASWFSNTKITAQPNNSVDANETIYEDAEDGDTLGWTLYNSKTGGVYTVANVADDAARNRAIEINTSWIENDFWLRREDGSSWNNTSSRYLAWDIKTADDFYAVAHVETNQGTRHILYSTKYTNHVAGSYTFVNLNAGVKDGNWHTIERDLQVDISLLSPGVTITRVDSFSASGHLRLDNIKMKTIAGTASVSGIITDSVGQTVTGVTLELNPGNKQISSDNQGAYTFSGIMPGTYTIVPANPLYDFTPASSTVVITTSSVNGINFTAQKKSAVIYEDAEDGDTLGWSLYSPNAAGVYSLTNALDSAEHNRVIDINTSWIENDYWLRHEDGADWNNVTGKNLQWDMKTARDYYIIAHLETNQGDRHILYSSMYPNKVVGNYLFINLPTSTKDDVWHTIQRDLQSDINSLQSGVTLTKVKNFSASGQLRLDNIMLKESLGVYTLPGNIHNSASQPISGVTVRLLPINLVTTTDSQGNFKFENLGSGSYTLVPQNSLYDLTPSSSVVTIVTSSPLPQDFIATLKPVIMYEDAEDGDTAGWDLYSKTAVGTYTLANVADEAAHNRVIEIGTSWIENDYWLRNSDNTDWHNTTHHVLNWDMKTTQNFYVLAHVDTNRGIRNVLYSSHNPTKLVGNYIFINLPTSTQDGVWHAISRDLQTDVSAVENGVIITAVNSFSASGFLRLDNIALSDTVVK